MPSTLSPAATDTHPVPEDIHDWPAFFAALGALSTEAWSSLGGKDSGVAGSVTSLGIRRFSHALGAGLRALPFAEALLPSLNTLLPVFAAVLQAQPDALVDRQHWLPGLLAALLPQCLAWYPQGGRENDELLKALQALTLVAQTDIEAEAARCLSLLRRQQERAAMLESRCREGELALVRVQLAQGRVVALLNQLEGVTLPESLADFLRTSLRGELQFMLLNQGDDCPAWQSWCAVIARLGQIFPRVDAPDEVPDRQQLYRDVQVVVNLLDEHVTVSASLQQVYDQGVEDLRERLFERLRGQSLPLVPFSALETEDELSRAGVSLAPGVRARATGLKAGDWFLFSTDDHHWLRCRLLLCPPDYPGLLFVNRSGQRVLQKTPQEFAACLAAGVARSLVIDQLFERLLAQVLTPLQALVARAAVAVPPVVGTPDPSETVEAAPAVEDLLDAVSLTDAEALPAEVEAEPASRSPARDPARDPKSAADKALQEARVLAKLEVRRERRAAASWADTVISPETADAWIDGLNIGAWLELPVAGELRRCKLVAIMRANERYIFTDRQGSKVAELERAQLVEWLVAGQVRIHSNGDNFEGQLSRVVKTLRRDH